MTVPTRFLAALGVLTLALNVVGCASLRGGKPRYPVAHAGVAHRLEQGTVTNVQDVTIDGQATLLGQVVGAGIGGAVGSVAVQPKTEVDVMVNDRGDVVGARQTSNAGVRHAAMGVGAAVGAVVGHQVEKRLTEKRAQEVTVQLDSGETIIVVQEDKGVPFAHHERVNVYTTGGGMSRVFHSDEDPFADPEGEAYIVAGEEAAESEDVGIAVDEPVKW